MMSKDEKYQTVVRKLFLSCLVFLIAASFISASNAFVILSEDCSKDLEKCILNDKLGYIFIFSDIEHPDKEQIAKVDAAWPADKPFPKVYLESNGGSIPASFEIGRILRKRSAHVETGNPFKLLDKHYAPRCRSACVFIAAGATKRQLGNIGLHDGHTIINWTKADQRSIPISGRVRNLMKLYLEEMGIDPAVFETIVETSFDDMRDYYFDPTLAGSDQHIVRWGFHQFDNPEKTDEDTPTQPVPDEPTFVEDMRFAIYHGIHSASKELAYRYASRANGRKPNHEAAMKAMLYAAIMEDVGAQHMMGHLLGTGQWGEKNIKESKQWFLKAAHNGFAGSQNNIGWAYYKGTGVPKSIPLAVHWITRSADGGEPFAYGSLCEMHGAGDVFPYDKQEAYKWCKLASLEMPFGEARNLAVKILNRYVARMTADELSVGKASVESWQPLRASKYTMGNVED